MRSILIIALIIIVSNTTFAQIDCSKYVQKKCDLYGEPFKYSGQSKNGVFELGQSSFFKLAVYGGFEYRIAICAERNMKNIFFRIREDNTNKSIIYDSSSEIEDYLEKMFFVENSKFLLIEVIVPEGDVPKEEQEYEDCFGCVGVVVEYTRKRDVGFD